MTARARPAVVLVADRTLSADYKILFEGMFATMQTTQAPQIVMRKLLSPPVAVDGQGRAAAAPLGLRRMEASLLARTPLTAESVVCTTPEALDSLLGPWVKVVAVSSSDPLGGGMSNTTTKSFWKGELYTRFWLDRMMDGIRRRKQEHGFKVIGGGAGAWQWLRDPAEARRQGFDAIFSGYFESIGPGLFMDIIAGKELPFEVAEPRTAVEDVQPIRGASIMGAIELSRGCGKGCRFCVMAGRRMEHLPPGTILADVERNLSCGIGRVASGSEDFFRYGGAGGRVNFEQLASLLAEMRKLRGLDFIQIDHGNISSILQLDDQQLREIRRLLTWGKRIDYLWVNMGIESASGSLVKANCPGKMHPFSDGDWPEMVLQASERMKTAGFFPVFSIIMGLPGETAKDIDATQRLVARLGARGAVIFPIFHEPVLEESVRRGERFDRPKMTLEHLRLYTTCYELNFKMVPRLFWDNQRAAGVSWLKRALLQRLGRVEVFSWRRNFARMRKEIASSALSLPN